MSKNNPTSLETLLGFMLNQQPSHIRESMINIAILTWFNPEVLEVAAKEYIPEGETEVVFKEIVKLNLAQPYLGLGYSFHEEIQRILSEFLAQEPKRKISVCSAVITYLRTKIEEEKEIKTILQRELSSRLIDLGQTYLQQNERFLAQEIYLEAIEILQKLGGEDNRSQTKELLFELGDIFSANNDWNHVHTISKKLLDLNTFNGVPIKKDVLEKTANYYIKEAEWLRIQWWARAADAYKDALKLYNRVGDLSKLNEIANTLNNLSVSIRELSSSSLSSQKETNIPETLVGKDDKQVDEIDIELNMIAEKMKMAWASKTENQ